MKEKIMSTNTKIRVWSNNWMAGIEDDTNIAEISIPGTHESCARFQLKDAQCQWFSIIRQLQNGIRFLDIRCEYETGAESGLTQHIYFPIYHGLKSQNILFEEVQAQCVAFLEANPTEFVLMNVQMNNEEDDPVKFGEKFLELIEPYKEYWYTGDGTKLNRDGVPVPDLPAIKDVRKHIVLIRAGSYNVRLGWWLMRANQPDPGLSWTGFNTNGESSNVVFKTQNWWKNVNGTDKGLLVEKYIREAKNNAAKGKITLNFASHTDNATPGGNAQDMNNRLAVYLQSYDFKSPVGVIAIDFTGNTGISGESLESQIIKHQSHQNPNYIYG
jgi:1-phosphatidylinositol phosphodiesterase